MIRDLDESLRALLHGEARTGSLLHSATVTFAAPDSTWHASASGMQLSVYLAHVGENRDLRSNERRTTVSNGWLEVEQYPPRIECTYLVTAWNCATAVAGVEQELQEHRLLTQALAVLVSNPILPEAYRQGQLASQEIDPPLVSAEAGAGGFGAEFWSSFGTYFRPALTCRVTVALVTAVPLVVAQLTTARLRVDGEERFTIGGTVVDDAGLAVAGAWVSADTGELATTDEQGRFVLTPVARGPLTLAVRAPGFVPGGGTLIVPSPTGRYAIELAPL
jgi:hypothetical protein